MNAVRHLPPPAPVPTNSVVSPDHWSFLAPARSKATLVIVPFDNVVQHRPRKRPGNVFLRQCCEFKVWTTMAPGGAAEDLVKIWIYEESRCRRRLGKPKHMAPTQFAIEGTVQMRFGTDDRISRIVSNGNRVARQGEVSMHDTDADGRFTRFGSFSPAAPGAEHRRFQFLGVRIDFVDGSRSNKKFGRCP